MTVVRFGTQVRVKTQGFLKNIARRLIDRTLQIAA